MLHGDLSADGAQRLPLILIHQDGGDRQQGLRLPLDRIGILSGRWTGERHDYHEGAVLVLTDPKDNEFCTMQYYRV
ncbi:hypothetical protein ACPPVO_21450 [Dactylosporangium sp. McL0621]|uniref:hypothetical protein n=1 Tax=Dactylosporangium sp. McL0621 TaxID=3415678 RepID=UPI003CEEAF52